MTPYIKFTYYYVIITIRTGFVAFIRIAALVFSPNFATTIDEQEICP